MTTDIDYENNGPDVDAEIHKRLSNIVTLLAKLAATRHLDEQIKKQKILNKTNANPK